MLTNPEQRERYPHIFNLQKRKPKDQHIAMRRPAGLVLRPVPLSERTLSRGGSPASSPPVARARPRLGGTVPRVSRHASSNLGHLRKRNDGYRERHVMAGSPVLPLRPLTVSELLDAAAALLDELGMAAGPDGRRTYPDG